MFFQASRRYALRLGLLLLCPDNKTDERLAENDCLQQCVWEDEVPRNVKRSSTFLILLYHFPNWKYGSDKHKQNGDLDAEYSNEGLFPSTCVQYKTYQQTLQLHGYTSKLQTVVNCMCAHTCTAYNCLYMSCIYTIYICIRLAFTHAFLCCKKSNIKYLTETSRGELFFSPIWNLSCTHRNTKVQKRSAV